MARHRATMTFARPAAELFAYMSDLSNAPEWDPARTVGERLDDGPVALGTRFRVVTEFGGNELELSYEVVEHDPPSRVVFRARNGPATIEDAVSVRAIDGGSELTYDARIRFAGIRKLIDPVAHLIFQRIGKASARGLREALGPPSREA